MRASRAFILLMVLLTLLGGAARLYKLDEKSLWSDEVATIATSRGNSIDPNAWRLRGKSFDPVAPVPASTYVQQATQATGTGILSCKPLSDIPAAMGSSAAAVQKSHIFNPACTSEVLKNNVHPPLFFWLMNGWIAAFGLNPGMLRLPAALFGILCIPLMALLALRLSALNPDSTPPGKRGRQAFALLSASFMALSAYQIDHAQDARQYTLLVLLALLSMLVSLHLDQSREGGTAAVDKSNASYGEERSEKGTGPTSKTKHLLEWLLLSLLLAAGLYTQYFFAPFAGFILLWLGWQGRRNKRFLQQLVLSTGLIAFLLLPWLPLFRAQADFLQTVGHYATGLWNPVQLPEKLWRIACEFFIPDISLGKIMPLAILALAALITLSRRLAAPASNESASTSPRLFSPMITTLLLWLTIVVGSQLALDFVKHSHTATIRRYLLLASPACMLLLAYALVFIGSLKPRLIAGSEGLLSRIEAISAPREELGGKLCALILALLMLGLMAFDTGRYLLAEHTSSDEFRQAAAMINTQRQPDDLVLVNKSGAMAVGMALYLKPDTSMLGVDVPTYDDLAENTPLMQRLKAAVSGRRRVWLVFSHAARSTQARLPQWLEQQGFQLASSRRVPGVEVELFTRIQK